MALGALVKGARLPKLLKATTLYSVLSPTLAGNSAIIVDPLNTQEITDALMGLIEDAALVENLKSTGLKRANFFSWQKNAEKTLVIYKEMVANN